MMEMVLMKTKTVSEELGVNPTTVQRWVRHFNIQCDKNEHGHYLFRQEDIDQLKEIKTQLDNGLLMSDIQIQTIQTTEQSFELPTQFEEKFNRLNAAIEALEKKSKRKQMQLYLIRCCSMLQNWKSLSKDGEHGSTSSRSGSSPVEK